MYDTYGHWYHSGSTNTIYYAFWGLGFTQEFSEKSITSEVHIVDYVFGFSTSFFFLTIAAYIPIIYFDMLAFMDGQMKGIGFFFSIY